ncbi:peptidoglycan-binding protein [Streptomyces filipinensis]|uniref:peptidoglycan-binding domain-containing protein n=1 Tax=Streptomyces filipinensis TaxID=66887 RepID=UPI0036F0883E
MPVEQHLNWTVLPGGLSADGTLARVSVFVAPRLQPDGPNPTLHDFPDFLDWPERMRAATFEFATADAPADAPAAAPAPAPADGTPPSPPPLPPPPVAFTGLLRPQGPPLVSNLWTSLFHDGTPLEPFPADPDKRDLCSYSSQGVRHYTKDVYATAAKNSPETPPPTLGLLRGQSVGEPKDRLADKKEAIPTSAQEYVPTELKDLDRFHRPSQAARSATGAAPAGSGTLAAGPPPADGQPPADEEEPAPPSPPPADFHTMLTSLGDHPVLLRQLGLVLTFDLPASQLPDSQGDKVLTVVPHWNSALSPHSHDVACLTRYFFHEDPVPSRPPAPGRRVFLPAAQSPAEGDPLASPSRGLVTLTTDGYGVEQADIDGAALKMLGVPEDATGLSPVHTQGILLIRKKRKWVLQQEFDRADQHREDFGAVVAFKREQAKGQPQAAPQGDPQAAPQGDAQAEEPARPVLNAQDLVRGHRMDIWDDYRKRWFSLHAREVEYRQPQNGLLLPTASDEGFFQAHLVSPPSDPALYVPETLAVWRGWSLSAPFPGLVLGTDEGDPDTHRAPNPAVPLSNEAPPGLPLEITVKAAVGSLPTLRYGHPYLVRLRTVDLAGNGLDLEDADAMMRLPGLSAPDPPLVFQRFEAVPAPAVVPRPPLAEGASTFRMVIRSSPGDQPPPAGPPGPPETGPRVSLANVKPGLENDDVAVVQRALMALGHDLQGGADGKFLKHTTDAYAEEQRDQGLTGSDADGTPGCLSLTELGRKAGFTVDCGPGSEPAPAPGSTAEQFAAEFNRLPLVTGQGHEPYRGVDERHVVAPKTSLRCVEWHGLLDEAIGSTDHAVQDAVYELAVRESDSLDDPGPDVRLEPVGSPAADPDHPAMTALHAGEQVEMRGLPDPLARGTVLFGLPGTADGEPFTVPWDGEVWHRPKSFRIRLAEGTAPPHFDEASRVLTVSLPKGAVATVRVCSAIDFDAGLMGMASWCLDPPEPRQGLAPQSAEEAEAERKAERQKAEHALDLAAASRHWMFTPWHELTLVHAVEKPLRTPVLTLFPPSPAAPRPEKATAQHLAGTIALDENSTGRVDLVAEWTEVTDAGPDGRATQSVTAPVFGLLTARADPAGTPGQDPAVLRDGVLTFSTEAAEDKAAAGAAPLIHKHEFGDTKHRSVGYHPLAGSRFGDYFPPAFAEPGRSELTVQGAARPYSVPSSAPPTAPRVLYCLPTLSLEQDHGTPDAIVRRRRGGGIRVYLGRPWYSTGDGELLGVVLGELPGGDPKDPQDAWVTLMGRDPLHRSAPVVAPTPEMFTNAVGPPVPLALHPHPQTAPLPVKVLGFTPQFDKDEKDGRWFCDLELDTGDACLPFVRLALVRYQPDSIPGAEISPVVLADVVRTLPDRELTVRPGRTVSVGLTGPSWDPTRSLPPAITAQLQRRHDVIGDADLGWVTLDDTATTLTSVEAESSHRPTYRGQVTVPPVRTGTPLRLLVMETEGVPPDGPAPATPSGPVIYCDTVDLPPVHDDHDDHENDDRHDRGGDDDGDDRRGPHGGGFRH